MKSPLTYLLLMRLKNQVLSWLKSPAKLIYLLFIAAMLAMVVFSGQANPAMPARVPLPVPAAMAPPTTFREP